MNNKPKVATRIKETKLVIGQLSHPESCSLGHYTLPQETKPSNHQDHAIIAQGWNWKQQTGNQKPHIILQ